MKKSIVLLALLLVIVFAIPATAKESVLPMNANKALIEDNLFVGMAYDNLGLQRSCALMLGKIQSDRAVVPLMAVLHNSADENLRVAAAWALCKIGDARGVYAVKMATKYDESAKVQATCAWYYENLVKQGTFTFAQPEPPVIAATK
ncbi:MAG: HEAT repeat domain-containing protein [Bacteroidota bacterium]|jgi:HEAT repeat protein